RLRRRQEDHRHQGGARDHRPGSEGGIGPGGRRAQAGQGEYLQGRGRDPQEEVGGQWRQGLAEVTAFAPGCCSGTVSTSRLERSNLGSRRLVETASYAPNNSG